MTKTMKRTDVHSPASPDFDPALYSPEFYVDFHPEDGNSRDMTRFVLAVIRAEGWKRGYGFSEHRCGHCGHALRYACVMFREDVKEIILVGDTCTDNRFELNKAEFDRLRKEGKLNAERRTRQARIDALYEEFPSLVDLSYLPNIDGLNWSEFLWSMYQALVGRWITDAQVKAADSAIRKHSAKFWERESKRVEEEQTRAERPSQHVGPEGTKVSLKGEVKFMFQGTAYSYYGPTPWMYVVRTESGDSVKFSTTSRTFDDVEKGDVIEFTGKVKSNGEYRGEAQSTLSYVKLISRIPAPTS